MKQLEINEAAQVSGGEAGVPHTDVLYGDAMFEYTFSTWLDGVLDWIEAGLSR